MTHKMLFDQEVLRDMNKLKPIAGVIRSLINRMELIQKMVKTDIGEES